MIHIKLTSFGKEQPPDFNYTDFNLISDSHL